MILGVRERLWSGFAAVAACAVLVTGYATWAMATLGAGETTMYEDIFGGTHLLAKYIDASWAGRSVVQTYLLTNDPQTRAQIRRYITAVDAQLASLVHDMDVADTDRVDVGTLADLDAAWHAYAAWRDTAILDAADAGRQDEAIAAYGVTGVHHSDDVSMAARGFLNIKREVADSTHAQALANARRTRTITGGIALLSVVLSLGMGLFLVRGITSGLLEVHSDPAVPSQRGVSATIGDVANAAIRRPRAARDGRPRAG